MASLNQKIRKQVNFYFSDSNLPYDKYLWTLHSKNKDHWIPLKTIASFKKMQLICDDIKTVTDALKEEETEFIELSEDGENIRRKGEVVEKDHIRPSIHVGGLPIQNVTDFKSECEFQDKVEEFFDQYSKVVCVRLKKTKTKPITLKGSAYIEFTSTEEAKKVAEMENLEMDGSKLTVKHRPAYHADKSEEFKGGPPKYSNYFNAFRPQAHKNFKKDNKKYNNKKFNNKDNNKRPRDEESEAALPEQKVLKTEEAKTEEAKTEEAKPMEVKTEEAKPVESKPIEVKTE
ncbi:hypothetical protein BDB01DRAFT_831827 [Pilobolus umbonatus]|nr:hypothetical protein BDB01DRAFT_831827 [Pilobolus umbonatus]